MKLTDFGLAKMKFHDLTNPTRERMRTTRWRAPEAFEKDQPIDWKKADIYSLGMTYSEILTGTTPFSSVLPSKLYKHITTNGDNRPKLPPSCPEVLGSLLEDRWKTTPSHCPPFSDIRGALTSIRRSFLQSDSEFGLKDWKKSWQVEVKDWLRRYFNNFCCISSREKQRLIFAVLISSFLFYIFGVIHCD